MFKRENNIVKTKYHLLTSLRYTDESEIRPRHIGNISDAGVGMRWEQVLARLPVEINLTGYHQEFTV